MNFPMFSKCPKFYFQNILVHKNQEKNVLILFRAIRCALIPQSIHPHPPRKQSRPNEISLVPRAKKLCKYSNKPPVRMGIKWGLKIVRPVILAAVKEGRKQTLVNKLHQDRLNRFPAGSWTLSLGARRLIYRIRRRTIALKSPSDPSPFYLWKESYIL